MILVNRMIAGEIPQYSLEKRYIRKDGSIVWVNLKVGGAKKANGSIDYFISVVEDITKRHHDSTFKLNMMKLPLRQLRATGFGYPIERLFDPVWYVETYPDAAGFRDGPLSHYLLHGEAEGRRPNPLFDPVWYVETYADRGARPGHALAHYLSNHDRGDFDPSPIFDTTFFRRSHEVEYGPGSSPLEEALDLLRAVNTDNQLPVCRPYLSTMRKGAVSGWPLALDALPSTVGHPSSRSSCQRLEKMPACCNEGRTSL